jgi:hypothetical protein
VIHRETASGELRDGDRAFDSESGVASPAE